MGRLVEVATNLEKSGSLSGKVREFVSGQKIYFLLINFWQNFDLEWNIFTKISSRISVEVFCRNIKGNCIHLGDIRDVKMIPLGCLHWSKYFGFSSVKFKITTYIFTVEISNHLMAGHPGKDVNLAERLLNDYKVRKSFSNYKSGWLD